MKNEVPPEFVSDWLDALRQRFEAGDKNALIQAIRRCFQFGVVAPEWVVDAFFRGTNRWYQMDVKSLDEALGVAWPKGRSLAAARKRRRLQFAVLNEVNRAKSKGRAVDGELFEQIGRRLGLGATLVKDYYRAARSLMGIPPTRRKPTRKS
jgi:hypothetical protein